MKNRLLLKDFDPVSTLKVKRTEITGPKFPVIDMHTHFRFESPEEKNELINVMNDNNMKAAVNLDGGFGDKLRENNEMFQNKYPGRMYNFCNIQYFAKKWELIKNVDDEEFESSMKHLIDDAAKAGVKGIKIFKELGLKTRDSKGNPVLPGDERLKIIWDTAAKQQLPVLYHIADPVAFFLPVDGRNERYEKMRQTPAWSYYGPDFPEHEELMESVEKLLENNRDTFFIFPHVLYPENLEFVSGLMDKYTNFVVDISARHKELGRQPYTARRFLIKYASRVLFGMDGYPNVTVKNGQFEAFIRFLETDDEYFNFKRGKNSRWKLYGAYLPDEVLKKIYYENSQRLLNL